MHIHLPVLIAIMMTNIKLCVLHNLYHKRGIRLDSLYRVRVEILSDLNNVCDDIDNKCCLQKEQMISIIVSLCSP